MKIAVLSGYLDNYRELGKHTVDRNKGDYCKAHGYDLHLTRRVRPEHANPASHASGFSWSRLADMLDLVESENYEWVYCVGCDTLTTNYLMSLEWIIERVGPPRQKLPIIVDGMPPGVPLVVTKSWEPTRYHPDGKTHVIFSCDRGSVVQADSFLVRGSKLGAAYLGDILSRYDAYKTQPWVEQQAMMDLRQRHASIMRIVPQHWMNSYDYSLYRHLGRWYQHGNDCYGNRGQWHKGDFLIHWPATSLAQRLELASKYLPEVIT